MNNKIQESWLPLIGREECEWRHTKKVSKALPIFCFFMLGGCKSVRDIKGSSIDIFLIKQRITRKQLERLCQESPVNGKRWYIRH